MHKPTPCAICGTSFNPKTTRSTICEDPTCKRAHKNALQNAAYQERRTTGWARDKTTYPKVCEWCGTPYTTTQKTQQWCTLTCSNHARAGLTYTQWEANQTTALHRRLHRAMRSIIRSHEAQQRATEHKRRMAQALGPAIDRGDYQDFLARLTLRVEHTNTGCWAWQGHIKDGYPMMSRTQGGRKTLLAVHRVVLEMREGRSLGSQAAHHTCGNSRCVNPDHLQPVTALENTAEMLARHSYLNRIAELEQALRQENPNHPVLDRIPLGGMEVA